MTASVAELIIRLQDEASKQAEAVARALGGIAKQEQHVGAQSAEVQKLGQHLATLQAQAERVTGVRDLQKRLADLQGQAEKARARVRDLSNALMAAPEATAKMAAAYEKATAKLRDAQSAVDSQKFAIRQANSEMNKFGASVDHLASAEARARAAIAETTAAIRAQTLAEERAAAAQAKLAARRLLLRESANVGFMVGGMYVGEKATELVHGTAETYKEFDDKRRFQAAILHLSPAQQEPFVQQAIHMGATTRFNDLQVLEAQTNLAQKKINPNFIPPFVEQAANYAGAMGTSLPDAVNTLEGIIFGTGKHIEDAGEAMATMKRVVNQSVKLAKIGGLDDEDIRQFFKYGAMPGSSAGLSDETLGATAALMRRANIHGDEAGVAVRTMAAKLVSPTSKGMVALDSMGINYNDFAKAGPISADNMARAFERNFGKKLTPEGMASLQTAVGDGDVAGDQDAFIQAFSEAASGSFTKDRKGNVRATDANKVAKFAASFWKNSVESIDSEGLLSAIMAANPTLAQLNAFFTDKQGARIGAALKDPALFGEYRDALANAPDDFGQSISDARRAGFSGAVDRFEGSVKNLETAIARSLDANGQGGFLTAATNAAGKAIQHIAELDPTILAVGSSLGIAASKVAEFVSAWGLVNTLLEFKASTALTTSAGELSVAAAALTRAAGVQAGEAALGGGGAPGAGSGGNRGLLNMVGSIIPQVAAYELGKWGIDSLLSVLPKPDKQLPAGYDLSTSGMVGRLWNDASRFFPDPAAPPTREDMAAHSVRQVDPGTMERARRAADEYRADPEAARGRATMEMHSLDDASAKAKETGDVIDGLNRTIKLEVDTSALDKAQAKANLLAGTMDSIDGRSGRLGQSIAQQLRGIHADIGIGHR